MELSTLYEDSESTVRQLTYRTPQFCIFFHIQPPNDQLTQSPKGHYLLIIILNHHQIHQIQQIQKYSSHSSHPDHSQIPAFSALNILHD